MWLSIGRSRDRENELGLALMMGGAWVLNRAVAEWLIRRQRVGPRVRVAVAA